MKPVEKKPETEEEEGGTLELFEKDEGTRGAYDDDDELGWVFKQSAEDEKSSKASIRAGKWLLKVKDTVPCFGPGMDFAVGTCPTRPTEEVKDMVIAGGMLRTDACHRCIWQLGLSIAPNFRCRNLPEHGLYLTIVSLDA